MCKSLEKASGKTKAKVKAKHDSQAQFDNLTVHSVLQLNVPRSNFFNGPPPTISSPRLSSSPFFLLSSSSSSLLAFVFHLALDAIGSQHSSCALSKDNNSRCPVSSVSESFHIRGAKTLEGKKKIIKKSKWERISHVIFVGSKNETCILMLSRQLCSVSWNHTSVSMLIYLALTL